MKTLRADLALIGVTAIWGCTFLLVQNALHDVSPILFLGLRFAVASCALYLVYRRRLMKAAILPGIAAPPEKLVHGIQSEGGKYLHRWGSSTEDSQGVDKNVVKSDCGERKQIPMPVPR